MVGWYCHIVTDHNGVNSGSKGQLPKTWGNPGQIQVLGETGRERIQD